MISRQAKARRVWPWGLLLFVLGFIVSALASWPIIALPRLGVAGLTPVRGTIWQGQWQYAPPGRPTLTVDTRFVPQVLWHGALGWHIQVIGQGITGQALLSWRGQQQDFTEIDAVVDVGSLPLLWRPTGTLRLRGTAQMMDGVLNEANLTGQWQNARVTTTEPLSLGQFSGTLTIQHQTLLAHIHADQTANAPLLAALKIEGHWPVTTPPHASGFVQPTAAASSALSGQLSLLGTPDADGRIPLNGVLPVSTP